MGRRIFVGNLAYGTNEETLRGLFDNGERNIVDVRIITDRETGKSRGFGFVELDDDGAAQAAIEQLDGVELEGRRLALREAFDRKPGGGGGGGGGRPPRSGGGGRPPRGGGNGRGDSRGDGPPPVEPPPPDPMELAAAEAKAGRSGRGEKRSKGKKRKSSRKKWDDDDW